MYLGVDCGQTGTRGVLVSRDGTVLASAEAGGLLDAVAPGGVERMRDVLDGDPRQVRGTGQAGRRVPGPHGHRHGHSQPEAWRAGGGGALAAERDAGGGRQPGGLGGRHRRRARRHRHGRLGLGGCRGQRGRRDDRDRRLGLRLRRLGSGFQRSRLLDPETIPSTVYRTLDVLEEMGLVRHGHLYCSDCGAVEEISEGEVASVVELFRSRHAFAVDGSHITIVGRCESCRDQSET